MNVKPDGQSQCDCDDIGVHYRAGRPDVRDDNDARGQIRQQALNSEYLRGPSSAHDTGMLASDKNDGCNARKQKQGRQKYARSPTELFKVAAEGGLHKGDAGIV